RLNSLPDPDVLSTLLLDFIRADSISAVNVLLKDGADLNFPKMFDIHGIEIDKPLNVAVECASLGMVRLLLKRGADIHQVGIGGTALHVATKAGRCDVAAFLLQCGARVQSKDREKKTVMDVVNTADVPAGGDGYVGSIPSPMKKMLELHQRSTGMRDYDSELSESDEMTSGRGRAWFYPSDHDDEYGDDDDDIDDDDEEYYMDYDDEEDDDEEGYDAGQRDEIGSDDGMAYDISSAATPSNKRRILSVSSESEMKMEESYQPTSGGDNSSFTRRRHATNGDDQDYQDISFSATPDDVYGFSLAIFQCLLAVLHDMDIQNVERSVISTMACVLEMAPSQLIRSLKETDVVLILDTVHFLLQGDKHHQFSLGGAKFTVNSVKPASDTGAPTCRHLY
ncbi:HECT E3 ubiquitin ligase, partial [Phytophthora palmivora]